MRKLIGLFLLLTGLSLLGGCFGMPITVLSSHSLAAGPDTQVDAVWIEKDGVIRRCTNSQNGPVCPAAQER